MNWIILILAGLFETAFALCLGKTKESAGNENIYWWIGFIICLIVSMILLSVSTRTIPIGTAYPVWTGIGAVGTVIVGILIFKEPAEFWRLFFVSLLIFSVVGLKVVSK